MRMIAGILGAALLLGTPAQAEPRVYEIDPSHTQTLFSVGRFGFTSIFGVFARAEGEIVLDEADPAASRVTATVTSSSLWSSDATRDQHILGPRWLNAAAAPTMRFVSTRVERTGDNTARVTGDMTINGITRPVTLSVTLNKLGANPASPRKTAGFSVTGTIDRREFGLTTAPNLIANEVSIRIEALALERAAQ